MGGESPGAGLGSLPHHGSTECTEVARNAQVAQPIEYKGVHLPKGYIIDLLVENTVVVEIKSVENSWLSIPPS